MAVALDQENGVIDIIAVVKGNVTILVEGNITIVGLWSPDFGRDFDEKEGGEQRAG